MEPHHVPPGCLGHCGAAFGSSRCCRARCTDCCLWLLPSVPSVMAVDVAQLTITPLTRKWMFVWDSLAQTCGASG